jgi:hypothetical protein
MIPIHHSQIGGGKVERPFRMGEKSLPRGTVLSGEEVRSIRISNRSSLIDKGYLSIWPKEAVAQQVAQQHSSEPQERHVVNCGFGRYNVVEGRRLNEQALDKESAYLLAGKPLPANGKGEDKTN